MLRPGRRRSRPEPPPPRPPPAERPPRPPAEPRPGSERLVARDPLRREAVADPEVRVDVAPLRRHALELLAQLAHEDVDRAVAVDHRVAPHALVDLLARHDLVAVVGEQLDELELAAREVGVAPGREGLELVEADLELAGHRRDRVGARLGAAAAPDDGLRSRDDLLRVAGLGDPVVGAEPEPAHALGDGRLTRADHDAQLREPGAQLLEVRPRRRAEHGEVDDERVQPHREQRVERDGRGQHAVLPAGRLQPLGEDLYEAGIGVKDSDPCRGRRHAAWSHHAHRQRGYWPGRRGSPEPLRR